MQHADSRIRDEIQEYTFREFGEMASKAAEKLLVQNVSGLKCGILCENSLMTALGICAAWEAGMIPVPMSLQYGNRHCAMIAEEVGFDILITDMERVPIEITYCVFSLKNMRYEIFVNGKVADPELSGIAVILNTSGTTGKPKGVLVESRGLVQNVESIIEYFKITKSDTILIARPLYHCAVFTGEFLVALHNGLDIFFYNGEYNPMAVYKRIQEQQITVICGTPTLLGQISRLKMRDATESSIRVIALSGECLASSVAQKIRNAFQNTRIYNVYGLTEASPRVSFLPPEMFDEVPEAVGFPLSGIEIKITDPSGRELIAGESGRICVKTPSVMRGYYKKEAATKEKIINGWLQTGDIGYKDEAGRLYILSREDDMIIKAGMNIYPKEIENLVSEIPEIKECISYGYKDTTGMAIGLRVVLNPDIKWDIKKLSAELSEKLPPYLFPGRLDIVEALPRNASGKLIRKECTT